MELPQKLRSLSTAPSGLARSLKQHSENSESKLNN